MKTDQVHDTSTGQWHSLSQLWVSRKFSQQINGPDMNERQKDGFEMDRHCQKERQQWWLHGTLLKTKKLPVVFVRYQYP